MHPGGAREWRALLCSSGLPHRPEVDHAAMDLDQLLDFLWREYSAITPDAPAIHRLLAARGEEIVNDHIAFRTYNLAPIGLESLARPFLERGYVYVQTYHFERKGLRACSYAHPEPDRPRLFISEHLTERFSTGLQETVRGLVADVPAALGRGQPFPPPGPGRTRKATGSNIAIVDSPSVALCVPRLSPPATALC